MTIATDGVRKNFIGRRIRSRTAEHHVEDDRLGAVGRQTIQQSRVDGAVPRLIGWLI